MSVDFWEGGVLQRTCRIVWLKGDKFNTFSHLFDKNDVIAYEASIAIPLYGACIFR